jgi:aminomethyltransferase
MDCYITRSGYTGEDGFEISVSAADARALADRLLAHSSVKWIGLGARDSLRLEAGLCLYGQDLTTETSPVEASIAWSICRSRRADGAKAGGFLGADIILDQLANGAAKKRVGFVVEGRAPVREGAEIVDQQGAVVGQITSGGFGPTLQAPVALGYVPTHLSAVGTQLNALVRGKQRPITGAKLPLVPQRYFRG